MSSSNYLRFVAEFILVTSFLLNYTASCVVHLSTDLNEDTSNNSSSKKESPSFPFISEDVGGLCKLPYSIEELNARLKYDPETRYNAVSINFYNYVYLLFRVFEVMVS